MARLKKIGTVDINLCEVTPFVFNDRLYRLENVRGRYPRRIQDKPYHRLVDIATGEALPPFAEDSSIASAIVEDDTVYVYGNQDKNKIILYRSRDLKEWTAQEAFSRDGYKFYNTSVCKGDNGYVLAFEIFEPPEETGVQFTTRFLRSQDLLNWELTPFECAHDRTRYTACPTIRFFDGFYYMTYDAYRELKGVGDSWLIFEICLTRSRDLVHWEESPLNPILSPSADDKSIIAEHFTTEERELLVRMMNNCPSDIDYCEFEGQTVIYYTWGVQGGHSEEACFLAHALYDGTLQEWMESYYPD